MKELSHAHIVTCYAVEDLEHISLILEFVDGGDLFQEIARRGFVRFLYFTSTVIIVHSRLMRVLLDNTSGRYSPLLFICIQKESCIGTSNLKIFFLVFLISKFAFSLLTTNCRLTRRCETLGFGPC